MIQMKNKDVPILREQLLLEQNELCTLCGQTCESPCLDHSHFSGKIRGVICRNCNVALGRFENGCVRSGRKDRMMDIAMNLFTYLSNERDDIHPTYGKIKKRRKKPQKIKKTSEEL